MTLLSLILSLLSTTTATITTYSTQSARNDIVCDNANQTCNIECTNDFSCNNKIIHCPQSDTCDQCTMQCTSTTCRNITIYGNECDTVIITSAISTTINTLSVFAPKNGVLNINAPFVQESTITGTNSKIVIQTWNHGKFNNNTIQAGESDSLSFHCETGSHCIRNTIYCPSEHSNTNCNIFIGLSDNMLGNTFYCQPGFNKVCMNVPNDQLRKFCKYM